MGGRRDGGAPLAAAAAAVQPGHALTLACGPSVSGSCTHRPLALSPACKPLAAPLCTMEHTLSFEDWPEHSLTVLLFKDVANSK